MRRSRRKRFYRYKMHLYVQSPSLVVGEKTKLYMSDESYLFGAQPNLSSIPLHRDPSYRLGLGHKFQHTSGAVFTGELSVSTINIEANSGVASSSDKPNQARLSTKYLAPLGTNSGLSAGLTTDIGNRQIWSTLELGMSLNLKDNLSLNLNHDYGKSISSGDVLHQTGIALEKKF